MPELPVGKVSKKRPIKYGLMLAGILLSVFLTLRSGSTSAAPNSVIINELMYNPTGGDTHEFLELYNTTGSPIDMTNWAFTQGITHTFANGTIIPANGYLTMASNSAGYQSAYGGGSPDVQWTSGSLSNGGEALTLVDETAAVINSITYDDVAPWPTSPDGSGPSLELKQLNLDNSDPTNWGASIGAPTPGVENSWVSVSLPVITSVSDPNDVTDADTVTITANIADADTVELAYKVNFDSDVVVPMLDDGLSGDGAASDGQYAADIPAQSAGQLVRFKISATNNDGTQTSPSVNDSMEYGGYYIRPPVVTNAPVIDWFMEQADYDDMLANHRDDNVYLPAVVVYENEVYDSSLVRVRGDGARREEKSSFKFKLPKGSTIQPDGAELAISEFALNGQAALSSAGMVPAVWWVAEQSGLPVPDVLPVRLQQNGQFYGLYLYIDKYDKEWRQANGFDDGETYEDITEVVDGANNTVNSTNLFTTLNAFDRDDPAAKDFVYDNIDIPNFLNYMSAIAAAGMSDNNDTYNVYSYLDSSDTNRWSRFAWDMDASLKNSVYISPYDYRQQYYRGRFSESHITASIYRYPELRSMHLRRLRTIVDKVYGSDEFLNLFNSISDLHEDDMELDLAKWPNFWGGARSSQVADRAQYTQQIKYRQRVMNQYQIMPWSIPPSQTQQEKESVFIDQVQPNANNADEYIIISSSSSSAVDISDWLIEGIDYTIPKGVVIPPNGSIYFLKEDYNYRLSHAPVLAGGQYPNDLGGSGNLILKTDTGQQIDNYAY